jgi:hypothetical protein
MFAAVIAGLLAERDIVEFDETGATGNTFINHLPAKPDVAVRITEPPGNEGDFKFAYDRPSLQVWVRGDGDPRTAENLARSIYDSLQGMAMVDVGDTHIVWMLALTTPGSVGHDGNGRYEYVINFNAEVKALVPGNREL